MWHLARDEKSLHQFALAADDQAGKTFKPVTCGDFRVGVEPSGKGNNGLPGNLTLSGAGEKMLKQGFGQVGTSNPRHPIGDRKSLG